MKLNNKGYLIVEIVLAGCITFFMAYFLINLVLKVKDRYTDTNVEVVLLNDKTIITNEIMNDILEYGVSSVSSITNGNGIKINYKNNTSKELTLNGHTIKYGSYTKELSNNGTVSGPNIEIGSDYFSFKVSLTTKYSTKDYGINIFGYIEGE